MLSTILMGLIFSESAMAEEIRLKCEFHDGSGSFNLDIDENRVLEDGRLRVPLPQHGDADFVEVSPSYIRYGNHEFETNTGEKFLASTTTINRETGAYEFITENNGGSRLAAKCEKRDATTKF
jgi:hypothetical protein